MKIHVVQKGDTLWELAKKYGVDFNELKQLNPQLSSPDMIMPGMKIKIPGSTKAVQKEGMKETHQPSAHPYKEMQQPKPIPVIKEEQKEKPKHIQPHMPMQPHMPPQPQPIQPHMNVVPQQSVAPQQSVEQIQPIIQMPIMEQELKNYTSVNIPEMQHHHHEKPKKHHKKPQHQPMPQPMPMPMPIPQPVAMVPMCCHVVNPCGPPPMPYDFFPVMGAFDAGQMQPMQPMHHHHGHGKMMESSSMEMPIKPTLSAGEKDCGCKEKTPFPQFSHEHPMHQPFYSMQSPDDWQPYPEWREQQPVPTYPPQWSMTPEYQPFPTPPGYPDFSADDRTVEDDEDESSGE